MSTESLAAIPKKQSRNRNWPVLLGLTGTIVLTGCAATNVKMGRRVSLDKIPVVSMSVKQSKGRGIAPGEKSALVVTLTAADGTQLVTEGEGHGKVQWKDLAVTSTVVQANNKGVLSLPADPRVSDGKLPHVMVTVANDPKLRAELDIPVRYDTSYKAKFSGADGFSGLNGNDGMDGSNGLDGSLDPEHPSAGGNGTDGANGTDGQDGGHGWDGPAVQVTVAEKAGSHSLLQMAVAAQGREELFLVDPNGGSLAVSSVGGSGGSGGKGGRGGRGGRGGVGMPSGLSGRDGLNGRDGSNGFSGNGGKITVTYDPSAKPFLSAIRLSNPGGPPPVFVEKPVAPLW
jgi:hypothetical protein